MLTSRLARWTLPLVLAAIASAAPTTFYLNGVKFDDGGTASGSFTYDPAINHYSNVNIITTTGASRTGATYKFVCGQDVPSCTGVPPSSTGALYLTTTAANQTGMPGFAIFFTGVGLTNGLGTANCFDISNSSASVGAGLEATCSDAACSAPAPPERVTVAGSVCVPDSLQITYVSNLITADAGVNITNTGASATAILTGQTPPQNNINGGICVNIYGFAADEQEVACCSCYVTPNGLYSFSVKNTLLNNVLTPSIPNELVIKLIASAPIAPVGSANPTCNPALVDPIGGNNLLPLANGMSAWAFSSHQVAGVPAPQMTERQFATATFDFVELQRDIQECQFIQVLGSGQFGICKGCQNQGLGAGASAQ